MLTVIVFLAIEASSKEDTIVIEDNNLAISDGSLVEEGTSQKVYAAFALIVGLINPFSMSIKHLVIKRYTSTYPPLMQSVDGFILDSIFYSCLAIYFEVEYGLVWDDLKIGTLAGILMSTGRTLVQISVSFGIAGACQALFSTYSLW